MAIEGKFGFIGGGNMGEALIKGLLQSGRTRAEDLLVSDPDAERGGYLTREYQVGLASSNDELIGRADILVLAVKPQHMDMVLQEISPAVRTDHLLISIAAGVTLSHLQSSFKVDVPILRVMPNTPALVLAGVSAIAGGAHARADHLSLGREIFESVGLVVEVEEKHMDIVTGLSGSGPAYIFVLTEALIDAAVRLGLPRAQARILAVQTIAGSSRLVLESGKHPGELKDMVTSPGGTTAAGLFALEKGGFRGLIMEAVAEAALRSKELGGK